MNRIEELFKKKNKDVLSVYFTAGYPALNDTVTIIRHLQDTGVDLIEIGIPFSDPLADGPVIQQSGEKALDNGMNLKLLFSQLKDVRKDIKIPLLLMGYLNPVLQYGIENFCKTASECGIDGFIIPDLPMVEYLEHYKPVFEKYDLKNIFLITPQTSEQRIRFIDEHSSGFIYMVSSYGVTGKQVDVQGKVLDYFKRVDKMKLKNPVVTGFGIHDKQSFKKATEYSAGGIIGSAFIKALNGEGELKSKIQTFITAVK